MDAYCESAFIGGRIVFFSSSTTKFSSIGPTYVLYAATKGAVEQLTRVLAKDFGAKGTTVNCVAPGPVDTEMFRNGKTEELIGSIASLHPQNRIAESDEIAPIVAFLSREEAEWVNGQTIFVNGVSFGMVLFLRSLALMLISMCRRASRSDE